MFLLIRPIPVQLNSVKVLEINFICIFIEFIYFLFKDIKKVEMFDEKVILPEQLPVKEK